MLSLRPYHNARYAKLRRQVGKVHFDILEVRNWLCKGRYSDIVCERQNLSLSVWRAKKVHEIFNTYFRFIKCDSELSLRAKIFLILRVIGNIGYLPKRSTYRDNHIMPLSDRAGQRTSFRLRHKLCDVVCYFQASEICPINDRKSGRDKTLDLQVRSERTGSDIFDVVANSTLRKFHVSEV